MPMYWGSITNQNSTNQNSDALDRACRQLCGIPEGLFRDFKVPAGMDRELAIHIIMREHGLAPLYRPDPYWMIDAIRYWTQEMLPIWEKLYSTTQLKYNPIWNTDATERTTDIRTVDRDTSNDRTAQSRGEQGQKVAQVTTSDHHDTASSELHETSSGTADGTTHGEHNTDTTGTGHTDTSGLSNTVDTSNTKTVNKTVVDGTDKKTTESTKNLDQTVTRDISPENAPDYQPDDQTHTAAEEKFKSTENGEHKETTDFTGDSTTNATSTTTTSGTSDTKTTGNENGTTDGKYHDETTGKHDQTTASKADGNTKGTADTKTDAHDIRHDDARETGKEKVTETYNHGWIRQGNIGVTTTQQMIAEERESVLFDAYMAIANDYHAKFCLDVY